MPITRTHNLGRPRNPQIEERVVKVAYKILAESGFHGLSFAKISALSGVARPTLKLRWRTREDICITTIEHILDRPQNMGIPEQLEGHNMSSLITSVLEKLIAVLNNPETSRILTSLTAAAHFSGPLSDLRKYLLSRHGLVLRHLVQAGIDSGEFAKSTNVDFALDALNGPIVYRALVLGKAMEPSMAASIVKMVLPQQSGSSSI